MKACVGRVVRLSWVAWMTLAVGACGPAPEEDGVEVAGEAAEEEGLQGGRATSAYAPVGLVVARNGAICTGTLIRDRVVLTAAHCADGPLDGFYTGRGRAVDDDDGDLQVALASMTRHTVKARVLHPKWRPRSCGRTPDLALLRLGRSTGISPRSLATTPPEVDTECTVVGFGVHGEGDDATMARKRSGKVGVRGVSLHAVEVGWVTAQADHGDSGGPLLCGGKVAGVTSCGPNGDPEQRTVFYARTDRNRAWVDQVIAGWEGSP